MNEHQLHLVEKERDRLQALLGNNRLGYCCRCVTAVARSLLLAGPFFYNGRYNHPKAKSLGAGVYEVWLENWKEQKP